MFGAQEEFDAEATQVHEQGQIIGTVTGPVDPLQDYVEAQPVDVDPPPPTGTRVNDLPALNAAEDMAAVVEVLLTRDNVMRLNAVRRWNSGLPEAMVDPKVYISSKAVFKKPSLVMLRDEVLRRGQALDMAIQPGNWPTRQCWSWL